MALLCEICSRIAMLCWLSLGCVSAALLPSDSVWRGISLLISFALTWRDSKQHNALLHAAKWASKLFLCLVCFGESRCAPDAPAMRLQINVFEKIHSCARSVAFKSPRWEAEEKRTSEKCRKLWSLFTFVWLSVASRGQPSNRTVALRVIEISAWWTEVIFNRFNF